MQRLEALAKRCSDPKESVRAIDADIHVALGLAVYTGNDLHMPGKVAIKESDFWQDAPRYTSSLDVAVTLIPDGHDWILKHINGGLTIGARVGHNDPDRTSWGDTAAGALCAAALRARAAL